MSTPGSSTTQPRSAGSAYPPAPWHLHGQLWLSLFTVRPGSDPVHPDRPGGVYGVALVSYEDPSPLVYSELLVARPVRAQAQITDIWVDSPASRDGGRDLWAIPKDLATFRRGDRPGPADRTTWDVAVRGRHSLAARFTDVSRHAPVRTPFAFSTRQVREDGEVVVTGVTGTGRVLPCRSRWDVDPTGPLGWLAGARPRGSVRVADFAMTFGTAG
ncbi:acetoacetate decarboxylase family protein [Nocardioides korecus]